MIQSDPGEVVAAFLISSVGLNIVRPTNTNSTNYPITVGAMPPLGDRWVSVKDLTPKTEGKYHGCTFDPDAVGETVTKPVLQIMVQGKTYDEASLQIRKMSCALSAVDHETVNTVTGESVLFHACCIELPPTFFMQEEKNRRQQFVMNVKISISGG